MISLRYRLFDHHGILLYCVFGNCVSTQGSDIQNGCKKEGILRAVKRRRREKGVRTPFSYLCRVKIFTCEKNLLLAKNLKGAP